MFKKLLNKLRVVSLHYKKMGTFNATSYVIQRIARKNQLVSARLKNTNLSIQLRNDPYDTQVFTQIFIKDELNVRLSGDPQTIIDGGANIGLATLYLHDRFPRATIIAVEPEKSNFDLLVVNTKRYPNIFCVNSGIWNKSGRLQIIDGGNGNASFTTKELTESESAVDAVTAVTITDLMSRFGIQQLDLLKLDIEGSEQNVFEENYETWLSKTEHIIVETHPHLQPDCEATVMAAIGGRFEKSMTGEYFFFSRNRRDPAMR
jgi:FkbM family methyltransferase